MESTHQLGWICDANAECLYLSSAWSEFTGLTDGSGAAWLNAVHPTDRREIWVTFVNANIDHAEYRVEYRLKKRDGTYVLATAHGVPHFNALGSYEGMLGITTTAYQHAEQSKLIAENEQLKRHVLTDREREVLKLFAEGYTAETAAIQLGITENTVNVHSKNAAMKLGALNRLHAVVTAIRLNELDLR